ncbi:MAG: divergent polysaccharide deacetylase family protein [Alphaproteobacteria bacterium]|nr:divergent polysaccharide deacetylase family protein [Alphaproteobacteria bacterium]
MSGLSSFAPHLGAALGAGLMLAASLAFNAGAGGADAPPRAANEPAASVFELRTAAPAPASAEEAPQAVAAAPDEPGQAVRDAAVEGAPRLAVIMDDIADLSAARRALALPMPVTLSVLPYADDAPDIAALVTAAGGELFIHLPMEPVGLDDPGPYALTKALDAGALAARLNFALARTPGAVGFNNHMGSRMTADRAAMDAVFAAMDERWAGLVFVDSLTHPGSQAASAAEAAGLAALKRDVFLDHDRDPVAIDAQIEAALRQALETGQAIAIAHPRPETFEALEGLAARAEAAGVRIVTVRALSND